MSCDWSPFHFANFEIDSALNCLNTNLQSVINQLAPLKTVSPKRRRPWINFELQLLINKRKATEKRYLRSKNTTLLNKLLRLSDEVETLSPIIINKLLMHSKITKISGANVI